MNVDYARFQKGLIVEQFQRNYLKHVNKNRAEIKSAELKRKDQHQLRTPTTLTTVTAKTTVTTNYTCFTHKCNINQP